MSEQSPKMRVVDRFVDHGAPLSFRDLCARVLHEEHDYLILDLDKTTHLGRNLGELLAWELCAYEAYGESVTGTFGAPLVWRSLASRLVAAPEARSLPCGRRAKVGMGRDSLPRLGQAGFAHPCASAPRLPSIRSRAHDRRTASPTDGRAHPPSDGGRGAAARPRSKSLASSRFRSSDRS